ncbi:hypothetical protein NS226_21140 [Aureimonas ureilytica]|uniref:Uncharacterized protein n=1 Tax=Aureimonas ureilytica TaxID=401562 RepID=A0A175R3K8_9HYPH|nr:hypothetical protein [Aureimonas ureilytica]KTQ85098.1 hypothetical protein NS226_21140 [Aureimonas ureilytica]
MRADFPFSPPTGWVPSDYADEISPPPRDTPNDWIIERSNAHAKTPHALLAGSDESLPTRSNVPADVAQALLSAPDAGLGHLIGGTKIAAGQIVSFLAFFDLGKTDILVAPDGTWSSADTLPIDPSATMFCELGDGETLAFSLDEIARNHADTIRLSEPEMVTVDLWHWSDDVPFVLAIGKDGTLGFLQVVDEPTTNEAETIGAPEPETTEA